jgi:hypothetical protein
MQGIWNEAEQTVGGLQTRQLGRRERFVELAHEVRPNLLPGSKHRSRGRPEAKPRSLFDLATQAVHHPAQSVRAGGCRAFSATAQGSSQNEQRHR